MVLDSDYWDETLLKTQGKIVTLLVFERRSSQLAKQFLNMLRSVEGGIGSPSLVMELSPETGKARSCVEQQHGCTWVGCCCCCYRKSECGGAGSVPGWDSHPASAAMLHQCRQERICDLSIVLLNLVPLLLPASLPIPRASLTHGSVQKAKFNFADITEKPESALAGWKTSILL